MERLDRKLAGDFRGETLQNGLGRSYSMGVERPCGLVPADIVFIGFFFVFCFPFLVWLVL